MKKVIKCTIIDTTIRKYLSVSKKDFLLCGIDPNQISNNSGHTLNKIYLEEGKDSNIFYNACKINNIQLDIKNINNSKFNIINNYSPMLFNYIPKINDIIIGYNNCYYVILNRNEKGIMLIDKITNNKYFILLSNPFKYIKDVIK